MTLIGSHVGMNAPDFFLGSAKEAVSYEANTLMLYTGAPQNTKRRELSELKIDEGWAYLRAHGIEEIVIHAPYIINLANTVKPETYELAVSFLTLELQRSAAMGSRILILHPGAHVGAGTDVGTRSIVKGLHEVLSACPDCMIALETMAGKGSEIGRHFEELAAIYDGVPENDRLRVCFDTCHVHDAGYDIVHDFDGVIGQFDRLLGKDQIAVFHINDSKNERGGHKDRHANIGEGFIGFDALRAIVHHPDFLSVPKILETPYRPDPENPNQTLPPYKEEIAMLKKNLCSAISEESQ